MRDGKELLGKWTRSWKFGKNIRRAAKTLIPAKHSGLYEVQVQSNLHISNV